jgi:hypothetical protein
MSQQFSSRQQAEEMVIDKAQRDSAFRAELLANPRAAIGRALGVDFPPDLKITVVEEDPRSLYLVLPAPSASKALAEQELAGVVGGAGPRAEAEQLSGGANDAGKFSRPGAAELPSNPAIGGQQQH